MATSIGPASALIVSGFGRSPIIEDVGDCHDSSKAVRVIANSQVSPMRCTKLKLWGRLQQRRSCVRVDDGQLVESMDRLDHSGTHHDIRSPLCQCQEIVGNLLEFHRCGKGVGPMQHRDDIRRVRVTDL